MDGHPLTILSEGTLQIYRQHCIIAFEYFGRSLFNSNVMHELVQIFKGVAISTPTQFDAVFWEFVSTLDRLVSSPSGCRDLHEVTLVELLAKYPATSLMAQIKPLVKEDWFIFHQQDSAQAYAVETKFLKFLLGETKLVSQLYFTSYGTPRGEKDWFEVMAAVQSEEVGVPSERSFYEEPSAFDMTLQETVANVSGEFDRTLDELERRDDKDPEILILDKHSINDPALSNYL